MVFGSGQKRMSSSGMTLPEMLITLSVFAILIAIAAPSLKDLVADRRVAANTQELFGSMLLARSEAIKRQSPVSICKSSNGTGCDNSLTNWNTGWLVFEDEDADGTLESGDQLIRVFDGADALVSMLWNNGNTVGFNHQGQARQAGTFTLCEANSSGFEVRQIVLSLTGRARVSESGTCN
ncbi:GspH/FimT family pseudopilin [Endozoicomonas arenosclerae]|uniref:GspH/FimT family pseudopilin n=1 Tax=Endozoicomonas arenosclerae TaxID=1633495 RepID=UPI000ACDB820|nr:GspH/FimT family pseudopilin [Endozoicomonas arenosclerae]